LVSKVKVSFNPLDPRSAGARDFLKLAWSAQPLRRQNPKLSVEPGLHCLAAAPKVEISWVNGKTDSLPCLGKESKTILDDLTLRAVYMKNSGVKNPDAVEEEDYTQL